MRSNSPTAYLSTLIRLYLRLAAVPTLRASNLKELAWRSLITVGLRWINYSRTNIPNIFAVGDVTNRINLTPVAIKDGHAFADTEFGGKPRPVDHEAVATAVFSDPEVGCVGLTESEARTKYAVDIYQTTFRPMKATLAGSNNRSLMKLVVDAHTDLVLGCHIVGEGAAELIQMVAVAVKMNATKADLDRVVPVHPTAAEELVTLREKSPARSNALEREHGMNAELTREAPMVRRGKHRASQPSMGRIFIAAAMPNHRTLHDVLKRKRRGLSSPFPCICGWKVSLARKPSDLTAQGRAVAPSRSQP